MPVNGSAKLGRCLLATVVVVSVAVASPGDAHPSLRESSLKGSITLRQWADSHNQNYALRTGISTDAASLSSVADLQPKSTEHREVNISSDTTILRSSLREWQRSQQLQHQHGARPAVASSDAEHLDVWTKEPKVVLAKQTSSLARAGADLLRRWAKPARRDSSAKIDAAERREPQALHIQSEQYDRPVVTGPLNVSSDVLSMTASLQGWKLSRHGEYLRTMSHAEAPLAINDGRDLYTKTDPAHDGAELLKSWSAQRLRKAVGARLRQSPVANDDSRPQYLAEQLTPLVNAQPSAASVVNVARDMEALRHAFRESSSAAATRAEQPSKERQERRIEPDQAASHRGDDELQHWISAHTQQQKKN